MKVSELTQLVKDKKLKFSSKAVGDVKSMGNRSFMIFMDTKDVTTAEELQVAKQTAHMRGQPLCFMTLEDYRILTANVKSGDSVLIGKLPLVLIAADEQLAEGESVE